MGKNSTFQIIVLIVLFGATSLIIHLHASTSPSVESLNKAHFEIGGGWRVQAELPLSRQVIEALALDDYVSLVYAKNGKKVNLYVGIYNSLKKIGASHSPLVCMPGQGWAVKQTGDADFRVGDNRINTRFIEAELNDERSLIVYWYQAYDQSSSGPFWQKLDALVAKSLHGNEKNAFVRISANIASGSVENEMELLRDFLKDFYPEFLGFMAS